MLPLQDLSKFSQYPHEREVLFPPLLGLQALSTRVQGSVLLAQIRLNLNMMSLTLEEVISKRRKLVRGPVPLQYPPSLSNYPNILSRR